MNHAEPRTFGMSREQLAELANLWHLSRTALGSRPSKYDRRIWASKHLHEKYPDVSSTAAYKVLDDSPWT